MYISEMDLIKSRMTSEGQFSDSSMIQWLLRQDSSSHEKKKMEEGERYFRCEHDILRYNFNEKTVSETEKKQDGSEKEARVRFSNPNRSNHHCVSPFHHVLVAQKVAYLTSKEPSITVWGAEESSECQQYEKLLARAADEEFNRVLSQWITGACNKGVEYLHVYYDESGIFHYCVVPAEQIIAFYDSVYERDLEQVIRYYDVQVWENGREVCRKKVEWWTKDEVTFYTENRDGSFSMEQKNGISPHWIVSTSVDGVEKRTVPHSWGRVPFIPLRNNTREMTDLELIKGLVDAYDLISSEGTNNLLDLVDLYWVIQGYGGETADTIAKKLQINKAVHISDSSGKVEARQVQLPVEGRLQWLKMLRKDIFHFGMGVDTDREGMNMAPSGISLKFQYALFHLKINGIVPEIKKAVKELFRFITEDLNERLNRQFDWKLIDISLNPSSITDDLETMQIIQMSRGVLSQKTLVGRHPFVDDVNREIAQMSTEKENSAMKEEKDFE